MAWLSRIFEMLGNYRGAVWLGWVCVDQWRWTWTCQSVGLEVLQFTVVIVSMDQLL